MSILSSRIKTVFFTTMLINILLSTNSRVYSSENLPNLYCISNLNSATLTYPKTFSSNVNIIKY